MRRSRYTFWLTKVAWVIILVAIFLIFLVPANLNFDNIALFIIYASWIILSPILATTWLLIRYRSFFRTWLGWVMPIIALIFSSVVYQDIVSVHQPNLDFFFTMLSIISSWAIGVATIILLWYRDVGLDLVGWGAVIIVWVMVFAWCLQGNLMEIFILALEHTNDKPSPLLSLICFIECIVPLGIIGFLGHTVRLIIQEWQTSEWDNDA
jgi:hypothetical protein